MQQHTLAADALAYGDFGGALDWSDCSALPGNEYQVDDRFDDEETLRSRALEGDVDALLAWRQMLEPVDEEELGWGW